MSLESRLLKTQADLFYVVKQITLERQIYPRTTANKTEINFPQFQPVCPLSHQGVAACRQPPLQPSYQRSHRPVSSRHTITLSNETGPLGVQGSQLRAQRPKVHHISLSPIFPLFVHALLSLSF